MREQGTDGPMSRGFVGVLAAAIIATGLTATTAGAQDPPPEPLPAGVPNWNWGQVLTSPVTVWTCRQRVERRGKQMWRVNFVARSKETEYQTAASARLVRYPRKKTLDDWSSGILEPGEATRVGRVVGDADNNDRITIGAGHKSGPYAGAGLGDTSPIRDINRC
jgi:hypothetical protein